MNNRHSNALYIYSEIEEQFVALFMVITLSDISSLGIVSLSIIVIEILQFYRG